jgi:hypothetical protein
MTDVNTEILRKAAVEVLCAGDKVRALLADQPGMADALLAAAAQKLRPPPPLTPDSGSQSPEIAASENKEET